jgi:hypothetical protein
VEGELELALVLSEEVTVPVPSYFTYHSHDPYAVHLVFCLEGQDPVRWTFARELLTAGMFHPAGAGDVMVRPDRGRDLLCLLLASPQGHALVELPVAPLAEWLDCTHRLVPAGEESRYLDLEASLTELLRETEPSHGHEDPPEEGESRPPERGHAPSGG